MIPKYISTHTRRLALAFMLAFVMLASGVSAQNVVRVTGQVIAKGDNEPLSGVNITDASSKHAYAVTDLDGKFAFNAFNGTTLRFSMVGFNPRNVKLKNGQTNLNVRLEESDVALGEVLVQTKRITDKIMPEQTDINIKGNYLYVSTRVRVPREMFRQDTRLVVQPILNNVTRGKLSLMRPLIYDAKEYHRTQDRLYNFNMNDTVSGDPLASYVTVKSPSLREKGRTNDIIGYNDSVYVDNVKDEYSCDVYMAIEDYTHILYRDTTIIARGTVNPLRWLDYSFAAQKLSDPRFLPKPEKQLRDSRGEVKLRFPIGKWTFNADDPQNAAEVEKLRQQIDLIAQQKDATLQSLDMTGCSSPDGKYTWNLKLAQKRINAVLSHMRGAVPENLRHDMTFSSKANVAGWAEVSRLLRADGHEEEAQQVDNIISRIPNDIHRQWYAILRLPSYKSLIEKEYLPRLRRVEYTMHYAIFRQLTADEINELYEKDYRQLTRFEFYKLYNAEDDVTRREKILRQALEVYPSLRGPFRHRCEDRPQKRGRHAPRHEAQRRGVQAQPTATRERGALLLSAGRLPQPPQRPRRGLQRP